MERRRKVGSPHAAIFAALALVATACGARLTDEQRLAGIGVGRGAGGVGTGTGIAGTAGRSTTTGGTAGSLLGGQAGQQGQAQCSAAGAGATDVGVTANQLTVATIANVTGVQPGLFKSAHQAMQALSAKVNGEGGVCGRGLNPLLLDDKTDSTGNRAAVREACNKSLALVGSMSAFDDGGADAVDDCGIPDITAITTNPDRANAKNVYAVYPNRADAFVQTGKYIEQTNPGVTDGAALLYLNAGVTRVNGQQRRKALEEIWGTEFVYEQAVQVVEANYTSYVLAMKNHEPPVEYVTMVSDYQSIVRLVKAMEQQDWYPKVMDWDSVIYSPGFLDLHDGAADGSLFFVNTALFEEKASNPEMQEYETWLARVAPGAKPDYFGLYAWSAGQLFVKLAREIGPKLTRKALFEKLRETRSWNGNGLHVAHDVGGKRSSGCFLYGVVQGHAFKRKHPSGGWDCKYPLLKNPL